MSILRLHRWVSVFVALILLYLASTGSLIESIDLKGLLLRGSPYDLNLQAMRGDLTGPGDYAVIGPVDYTGQALPAGTPYQKFFANTLVAARRVSGGVGLRYAELRMANGKPVAVVQLNDPLPAFSAGGPGPARGPGPGPEGGARSPRPEHKLLAFDPATGAQVPLPTLSGRNREDQGALRVQVKSLHRMTTFGNWALWINMLVGPALLFLSVSGLIIYVRQYRGRAKGGRTALFWKGQDWWRTLHRSFSMVCVLFLTVISLSGLWLAYESLSFGLQMNARMSQMRKAGSPGPLRPPAGPMPGFGPPPADPMSPIDEAQWPAQLATTLTSYSKERPKDAPRVVRLRVYAKYPQGVIVSGGAEAEQFVYNAQTGARMTTTEPGYPKSPFPFGWQAHQWAKQVHNGSIIGLTGRWMGLLSGLCLAYLSISGLVLYATMWRRRANNGKNGFFW